MYFRGQRRQLRWWGKQLALTGSKSWAHRHLLNCWKDAALRRWSIQWDPVPPLAGPSAPVMRRCSHALSYPASSGCRNRDQTSTPVSPTPENRSVPPTHSAEQRSHFYALHTEPKRAVHATDASGTALPKAGLMGVLYPGCTIRYAHTARWAT